MAVLKCKMCGGELGIAPGITIAECEYCGSMQTLPRVNDDRLASFYERANDLRMSHEFDKAVEIYEKIIEENPTDADAYWSMLLCQYGVDYVEETKGGERKPTINRAQLVSMFDNVNYRSAIKYADIAQRQIYEQEAKRIDRILQRYLEISRNEPAYDVFICYKESDGNGNRTIDSVHAGEIYHKLTAEGLKVFFAPISLEGKLGEDYEPYIFAAIHSAKVMIVIGTKAEYMNAVWVRNEWSRFLTLAKDDPDKTLIPVYRDMNPYDMPEAFRFKQAQNMENIGFILDLLHGVQKVVRRSAAPNAEMPSGRRETSANAANVDTLLQRAQIFLEDSDWSSASIYCEKVLDIVPTNGTAYLYKLMAEAKVAQESALVTCRTPLDQMRAYKNAVRYADEDATSRLIGYNQKIRERLEREEEERKEAERARREAERVRREQAQRDEDFRRRRSSISDSIKHTNDLIASYERERENVVYQIADAADRLKNIKKYKRKLVVRSLLVLAVAIILFVLVANDADFGVQLWFVQMVLAILLASARGKSKFKAFLLAAFSVGILPGFSAIRGLREAKHTSANALQQEQANCAATMQQLDMKISDARNNLIALNQKQQALEAEIAKADI